MDATRIAASTSLKFAVSSCLRSSPACAGDNDPPVKATSVPIIRDAGDTFHSFTEKWTEADTKKL